MKGKRRGRQPALLCLCLVLLLCLVQVNYSTLRYHHHQQKQQPIQYEEPDEELTENVLSTVEEAQEEEQQRYLTVFVGTHLYPALNHFLDEHEQDAHCAELAEALEDLWAAWDVDAYALAKGRVSQLLLETAGHNCKIGRSRKLFTFPLAVPENQVCDAATRRILDTKSYIKGTKVFVNWFLVRPDLKTLENLARKANVKLRIFSSFGFDYQSAAFENEGCPRFRTVLARRGVYKQRLLLLSLSDLQYQITKLSDATEVLKHDCSSDAQPSTLLKETLGVFEQQEYKCASRKELTLKTNPSHVHSMLALPLFTNQVILKQKSLTRRPTLVFVAGLEGVGHHMFAKLGARRTVRPLYDALTDYLCNTPWSDTSEERYKASRDKLVQAMKSLDVNKWTDGSSTYFLNTVFVEKAVNMYSFPWGGPRCYLKRFARGICTIDTLDLVKMAEEAGVDFRVVLLKRSIGAAVVSAALHRPYGTIVSESRMLIQNWALLRTSVANLAQDFVLEISYEELLSRPEESAKLLIDHLNVKQGEVLYDRFYKELKSSAMSHPPSEHKWKEEVNEQELNYMTDIMYLK